MTPLGEKRKAIRTGGLPAAAAARAVRGIIASSHGKASAVPAPRRNVRRPSRPRDDNGRKRADSFGDARKADSDRVTFRSRFAGGRLHDPLRAPRPRRFKNGSLRTISLTNTENRSPRSTRSLDDPVDGARVIIL